MSQSLPRDTPRDSSVEDAEREVIKCAMGIVNVKGWSFGLQGDGNVPVVTFPDSMRRLERAIAKLKDARKAAQKATRKAESQKSRRRKK